MADPIKYDDFARVELRVAKVLEARPHPNADKLMLLQISLGEGEEPRQIVAGIRAHYSSEQLVGKLIVVVSNLEPAFLRGETSNGMLLAATSHDGKVVLLQPDDPDCLVGAKIK